MAQIQFPRSLRPPKGSFFLFGPRGTGKSTWLRAAFPLAYTIDLLDESLYQSYLAEIGRFAAELRALPAQSTVIVDEVQRIPGLLNEVHRHMEERGFRFVLCGSSAHKLKKAGTNLLAGRAVKRQMHPLLPEELGTAFHLDAVLRWGSLPVIWQAPDRSEALEAYAQMYLKEEVQAEALVRNLPGFARFLPVAALFHAQVINVAAVARDTGVARTTAAGYLGVIEDTLLTFLLPAYQAKLRVQERRHPKLYWTDPGIVRAVKRQLGAPSHEERGHLFEGWIASVLRSHRDYHKLFDDWFYWGAGKGSEVEVDFLLRADRDLVAIEVKATGNLRERSFDGLRAVTALPETRRRIVVYLGDRRQRTQDGIELLPVEDFLRIVEDRKLF